MVFKHGFQFMGRSRQQHHMGGFIRYDNPRRGAVWIGQYNAALGHHGLFPVVVRRHGVSGSKKCLNMRSGTGIFHQFPAHNPGGHLLGQIVLRGTKAPGQNHHIRTPCRRPQDFAQALRIVPHHGLIVAGQSQPGTFFRQIGGIGIYDIAQQKFRSHANQFHCHPCCPPTSVLS